jgi:hypothetical protein
MSILAKKCKEICVRERDTYLSKKEAGKRIWIYAS